MGLVAVSLSLRTCIYAVGVLLWVRRSQPDRLGSGLAGGRRSQWVSPCLAELPEELPAAPSSAGFSCSLRHRTRGRTVCLIQLSQAVISTADLLVVGFMSSWWETSGAMGHRTGWSRPC